LGGKDAGAEASKEAAVALSELAISNSPNLRKLIVDIHYIKAKLIGASIGILHIFEKENGINLGPQ
jgi:hypothetical protein